MDQAVRKEPALRKGVAMGSLLVAGVVNMETTLKVPGFPVEYAPITYSFFDINADVSGGAYNVGKALRVLGDEVSLMSLIGNDKRGRVVKEQLEEDKIEDIYVIPSLNMTPQSVVLYDDTGKRQIFCDLKEVQQVDYPEDRFTDAAQEADMIILQNSNFCRPFLKKSKQMGKLLATDVHDLTGIHDDYNRDFMKYADILFVSDDKIKEDPYDFVASVEQAYHNEIIVMGRGSKGAMLYVREDNFIGNFPAVKTREIVNKVGAGDALFSAFLHFYRKTGNPYYSIKNAILFSSYKIGTAGSANGFLTEAQLEQYFPIIWK